MNIVRADDISALSDFICGVESMDEFIHDKANGLGKFIAYGLSNLWIVYEQGKVVAFFALSKDALVLNSDDMRAITQAEPGEALPSKEEDKFWEQEKYPAIEIDYLAVCKEKRDNPEDHLGTHLVDIIAQKAINDELSATMFLTVEALDTTDYSAIKFYRKCGFEFSEVGRIRNYNKMRFGESPTTQRMYKVLIPDITYGHH